MNDPNAFPTLTMTVTQDMIDAYGRVNGDNNRLHYDTDAARASGFSAPIAHGALNASVLQRACRMYFGPRWNEGGRMSVRFIKPLLAGDTMTTGGALTKQIALDEVVRETFEVWCVNGAGERIIVGEATGERDAKAPASQQP